VARCLVCHPPRCCPLAWLCDPDVRPLGTVVLAHSAAHVLSVKRSAYTTSGPRTLTATHPTSIVFATRASCRRRPRLKSRVTFSELAAPSRSHPRHHAPCGLCLRSTSATLISAGAVGVRAPSPTARAALGDCRPRTFASSAATICSSASTAVGVFHPTSRRSRHSSAINPSPKLR